MVVNNFEYRYKTGNLLAKSIKTFFDEKEVKLIPFGAETICGDNKELMEFLNLPEANFTYPAMMLKFAPDFILFKKSNPRTVYFLETKVSVTPLCYRSSLETINAKKKEKFLFPI